MRIALVNPNVEASMIYGKVHSVGNYQPPLGLAYLAAVLRAAGYQVKIIDAQVHGFSIQDVLERLKVFKPDMVGLTSTTVVIVSAIELAKAIKSKFGVPIVLGGAHVTAIPEDALMNDCFDVGIVGEAELTIVDLTERLEKGESIQSESIKGIAFKQGEKVVLTKKRELIEDLDSLPFPARDLLPKLEEYKPTPASCRYTPLGGLISSRGCVFKCIYCDRSIFGNKFRGRSPENVVDEIEELKYKHGAREIKFWDDTLNLDKERLIGICREMIERKVDLPWSCLVRVNMIDKNLLGWMKKAGCWQVLYGIESGNNTILKNARKAATIEMAQEAVNSSKEMGLEVRASFIFGLPGETEKTMKDTINFAKSLPLDMASFYIMTIYPNTDLWHLAHETGEAIHQSWDNYSPVSPENVTYVPNGLTSKLLKQYQKKAYSSFYLRPSYILRRLANIRNFEQLKWHLDGFLSIIRF